MTSAPEVRRPVVTVRCPNCQEDTTLYEVVEIEGWRALDKHGAPRGRAETDGLPVGRPTGEVGCGECAWEGMRSELEGLDEDGEVVPPPPLIHPGQLRIDAP